MRPNAHSAGRVCGPRSRAVDVRRPRELREPSFEGAQSSRVRRRLRSEARPGGRRVRAGRAAALPDDHRDPPLREGHELLARPEPRCERRCAQGGRQHVRGRTASTTTSSATGSRRASCAPAARPRSRIRPPSRSAYPEGNSEVGDPVEVLVSADYSLPFIGATITLRGSATMRLEQAGERAPVPGACA